ncbi:MAG: hypothetical protein O3A00_13965 [Planctomycetota bacterium]|nr:hypothetical protein [Planctomycetota bacterium]
MRILAILALVGMLAGCGETKRVAAPDVVTNSGNAELLATVLDKLDPLHLGVTSEREIAVSVLNDWWKTVKTDATRDAVELPDHIAGLVDAEAIERAERPQFSGRDGSHIRTCLMLNAIAKRIANDKRYPDDEARTLALFRFVNEAVSLRLESTLPLSPFECLMSGKGTAEDRAWIFASLLRQLRIDAVILKPKSDAADVADEDRWLVGALLDSDVLLFDANYGLPIPSPGDDAKSLFVVKAARLSEVKADSRILAAMNQDDRPYSLSDIDLSELRVEVITDSTFWAPRMRQFEEQLAGQTSAMFFDGLSDAKDFDGLIKRVTQYVGRRWEPADVAIWRLPEERLVAFEQLDEVEDKRMTTLMDPFLAPARFKNTPQGLMLITGYAHALFRGRMQQLLGDYDDVSTLFMEVRRGELQADKMNPGSATGESLKAIRSLHASAAEDAFFWGGICRWQLEDGDAAEDTLRDYLTQYKRGRREESCRYWLAVIVAQMSRNTSDSQKMVEAIELLESTPTSDPQRFGNRVLAKRWRAIAN